jgi:hypothetical protein
VETRKEEQKSAASVIEVKGRKRPFQIVKLEERIAPGNGHGNGSNICGPHRSISCLNGCG